MKIMMKLRKLRAIAMAAAIAAPGAAQSGEFDNLRFDLCIMAGEFVTSMMRVIERNGLDAVEAQSLFSDMSPLLSPDFGDPEAAEAFGVTIRMLHRGELEPGEAGRLVTEGCIIGSAETF